MNDTKSIWKMLALCLILTLPATAAEPLSLETLGHFRGTRLLELRGRLLEGAIAAGNAGAGYEAARLLQGLTLQQDEPGKRAQQILKNWGIDDQTLEASSSAAINERVTKSLKSEFQTKSDLKQAEVMLSFGDAASAARLLSGSLQRPLTGEALGSLEAFCQRLGLESEDGFHALRTASLETLETQLEASKQLVARVEAADFLLKADPAAGRVYWTLLTTLQPQAVSVRKKRAEREEDPRRRFGFGGRTMPPQLMQRFGRGFGGRGEEQRNNEEVSETVELSVDGIIESLDYLAKDDTELAIEILEMANEHYANDPAAERLKGMLEQAELYQLSLQAPESERDDLITQRFAKPRKSGKAAPIFDGDVVPTYEIEISDENWEALKKNTKEYVSATFRSGDKVLENIGVRLKGGIGSYRPLDGTSKVGLTLKMNQFVKGQKFLGMRKIMLNNSVQDRSMLREGLGYALYRDAGLPAPRVGHAEVVINGDPYGVYVQVEAVTSDFLKRWFQDGKGDLYEGAYGTDVADFDRMEVDSDPETAERHHLQALAEAAEDALDEGSLEPLEAHLDIEAFTRYLALEILMDHWDGYISTNNYRVYRDPETEKFYFLPHGADQLFRNSGSDLIRSGRGIVAQAIFETQPGRQLFLRQVNDLLAHVLVPERVKEMVRGRYDTVRALAAVDAKSSNTVIDFDDQMITTLEFFGKKQRLVRWQEIALDDQELRRRLESLNNDPRRFFRGGRGRR